MRRAVLAAFLILADLCVAFSAFADDGWATRYWRGAVKMTLGPKGRNAAMCLQTSCEVQGKNCGVIPDGCGGSLSCGVCRGLETCGWGGRPNVCGDTCYAYSYIAHDAEGAQNVFVANTCSETKTNRTGVGVRGTEFFSLSASRFGPQVAFKQRDVAARAEYMNIMSIPAGQTLLGTDTGDGNPLNDFSAERLAWSPQGVLAILAREADGTSQLRINRNIAVYPAADSRPVVDLRRSLPKDIDWIPTEDGSPSHLMIMSFGEDASNARLYLVSLSRDDAAGSVIPLEDGSSSRAGVAMFGDEPSVNRNGTRLVFSKNVDGARKLFWCNFDFSDLSLGRAYCHPEQIPFTRSDRFEYSSPCWTFDDRRLMVIERPVSLRGEKTSGEVRIIDPMTTLEKNLTTSPDDESEVGCLPLYYEMASTTTYRAVPSYESPPQYQAAPIRQTYVPVFACPKGQVMRDGHCVSE